jgi:hypothetical protein
MMFIACSRKPVFQVNYSLPQAATAYPGKQVYVSASDGRSMTQFATPEATRELKNFSGLFSLVVLKSENVGDLVGAFEIIPLMSALCKERLQASSVVVAANPASSLTHLEIVLKSFQLDYAKRKWLASMNFEAIATGPDGSTRRQAVNGSAERVKVWANKEAEALVSELASDMINKLDLERLLTN